MKTGEYILMAKKASGIESDYALAKKLGITRQAISNYVNKKSVMDDYTAAKVAELLGINALEVIAAANAEREKDAGRVAFWHRLATSGKAASLASVLILGGFLADSGALDNLQSIHYANLLMYVILAGAGIGLTYKLWREHGKTRTF